MEGRLRRPLGAHKGTRSMKKVTVSVFLFLALGSMLLQVLPARASVSWSSPVAIVVDDPATSILPGALQASNGTVWLAWQTSKYRGDSNFDIAYKTGILGSSGVTWSSTVRLTNNNGLNSHPSLVQIPNGTIFLFQGYKPGTNTQIWYLRYNPTGWSNPAPIVSTTLNDTSPSAAVGRDGTLWLVWTRINQTCTSCTKTQQLFYKTLKSGVWSQERQLTSDTNQNFGSSVIVGKDGLVRVVWSKGAAGQNIYQLYLKSYDGTTWSPDSQVVSSGSADGNPALMQDRNGTIWLFWNRVVIVSQTAQYDVLFGKYSYNNGQDLSTRPEIQLTNTPNTVDSWMPFAIQSINDKKIWLFYTTDPNGGMNEIWALTSINPIAPVCDVAVGSLSPVYTPPNTAQYPGGQKAIGQNPMLPINTGLSNYGDASEIVTVRITISNSTSYNLSGSAYVNAGGSTTAQLNWNTTGVSPGRYNLAATLTIVTPSCAYTVGNQPDTSLSVKGAVHIVPTGDVNLDGTVNIIDMALVAVSFGTTVGNPLYNPFADINGDGLVNIVDIVACATHFGQTG